MTGIEDRVIISSADWPSRADVAPGDLSKYAPVGLGLAAPAVVMPWDTLGGALDRRSVYASYARDGDPFRDAPVNDAAGGIVYFDGAPDPQLLTAAFALLDVRDAATEYAVFAAESANPVHDRYLAQIRIVEFGALALFGAVPNAGEGPWTQRLTIGELLLAFVEAQQTIWGGGMSSQLSGTLGGDGDWASEKLGFGFMVENASNGVYRLWSRPWLVTK